MSAGAIVLSVIIPVSFVLLMTWFLYNVIRNHRKSANSAGSGPNEYIQDPSVNDENLTPAERSHRRRQHRRARRRQLRATMMGQPRTSAELQEQAALFGDDRSGNSAGRNNSNNQRRRPRAPKVPPPSRGKEDEEWADAYNRVVRENAYALTIYELNAMFPAQKYRREKHDLYRLARNTSMKAREVKRKSTGFSIRSRRSFRQSLGSPRPINSPVTDTIPELSEVNDSSQINEDRNDQRILHPVPMPAFSSFNATGIPRTESFQSINSSHSNIGNFANMSDVSLNDTNPNTPIGFQRTHSVSTNPTTSAVPSRLIRAVSVPGKKPALPTSPLATLPASSSHLNLDLERDGHLEGNYDYHYNANDETGSSDGSDSEGSEHETQNIATPNRDSSRDTWTKTMASWVSFFNPASAAQSNRPLMGENNDLHDLSRRSLPPSAGSGVKSDSSFVGARRPGYYSGFDARGYASHSETGPNPFGMGAHLVGAGVVRSTSMAVGSTDHQLHSKYHVPTRSRSERLAERSYRASSRFDDEAINSLQPIQTAELPDFDSLGPATSGLVSGRAVAEQNEEAEEAADTVNDLDMAASISRAASVKRASKYQTPIPEDEDFVFCPICQGKIEERDDTQEAQQSSETDNLEIENGSDTTAVSTSAVSIAETSASTEKETDLYSGADENDDIVRLLSCNHVFHDECITPWLTTNKALCPLCKRDFRNEIPVDVLKAESV